MNQSGSVSSCSDNGTHQGDGQYDEVPNLSYLLPDGQLRDNPIGKALPLDEMPTPSYDKEDLRLSATEA